MRHLYSLAASLTFLCATVAAQQPDASVERYDRDDPCHGPRMPVLEPDEGIDPKMVIPPRGPEGIDPQMEVNACRRKTRVPLSRRRSSLYPMSQLLGMAPPRFKFKQQSGGQSQPSDPLRPQVPSALEMMRKRR